MTRLMNRLPTRLTTRPTIRSGGTMPPGSQRLRGPAKGARR
jgi:hypothetical protein